MATRKVALIGFRGVWAQRQSSEQVGPAREQLQGPSNVGGETPIPMVLLDKRAREEVGVQLKQEVFLTYQNKSMKALVNLQFKELVGMGVTINPVISKMIGVTLPGDMIDISLSQPAGSVLATANEDLVRELFGEEFMAQFDGNPTVREAFTRQAMEVINNPGTIPQGPQGPQQR